LAHLSFRVEDDISALFGSGHIGAAIEETVAVEVVVALLAATAEVEAAKFLLLGLLIVIGQVVGFYCADLNAARTGSAAGHDHSATTVGISLVLLCNVHLEPTGYQL
jgi:hypothetical protein